MRLQLWFTDYTDDDTGKTVVLRDVWQITRTKTTKQLVVKTTTSTANRVFRLDKIGNLQLAIFEE